MPRVNVWRAETLAAVNRSHFSYTFTAEAGDTVFDISSAEGFVAYVPDRDAIRVYVNGFKQLLDAYDEDPAGEKITFTEPLAAGDRVEIVVTIYTRKSLEATHNNQAGIQGGIPGEYYHLTAEQATILTVLAKAVHLPQEFTATAAQTVFTLTPWPQNIPTAYLQVYVNGIKQLMTSYSWESTSRTLTLSEPLEAGDTVIVRT